MAYVESHDWALVGDKTIAFWLMDKGKNVSNLENIVKISKTFTEYSFCHYFDGWMRKLEYFESSIFSGNEFGHPGMVRLASASATTSPTPLRQERQFNLIYFFVFYWKKITCFQGFIHFLEKNPRKWRKSIYDFFYFLVWRNGRLYFLNFSLFSKISKTWNLFYWFL